MNNFCLWSIFVKSASVSHHLEAACETHTAAAAFKIETPESGDADLAFVRHKRPFLVPNPLTIRNLPPGADKHQISPLVRHYDLVSTPPPPPTTQRLS